MLDLLRFAQSLVQRQDGRPRYPEDNFNTLASITPTTASITFILGIVPPFSRQLSAVSYQ
jgi:hypothetical protein